MDSLYCILDEHKNVIRTTDVYQWADFFENTKLRIIKRNRAAGKRISTIFLGLDIQLGDGPPRLFETMVFRGKSYCDAYTMHWSSYDQAVKGHNEIVKQLRLGTLDTYGQANEVHGWFKRKNAS